MKDEDIEMVGCIVFVGLLFFGIGYGAGFVCGKNTTSPDTRQILCREFMKETSDYINCNTKGLDEIIKIIKEQTNERNR